MKNAQKGIITVRARSGSPSESLMLRIQAGPGLEPGRVSMVPSTGLDLSELLFQSRRFVVRRECIHERSEFAMHHFGELVYGQTDAVITDAVLRIIVRPNFLGAVTSFDLSPALGSDSGLLLLHFHFIETSTKNTHGLGAILDLRFFVLLRDDEAAGKMGDAHRRVGGVDGLSALPGRAERVDAQILGFNLDVDFVRFREYRDGSGGGVDSTLRFGCRHALHAVAATFVFQLGVDLVALDRGNDVFKA